MAIKAPRDWPRPKPVEPYANIHKPIVRLKHAKLERVGDSRYKSKCPLCKVGVLPVRRDQETMKLLDTDACYHCGQRVFYTDGKKVFKE